MSARNGWARVAFGEVARHRKEFIQIDDLITYKRCRVQVHAQGVVLRDEVEGALIKTKLQQTCRPYEFLVAEIDAKMGGFGIVPPELDGAIVSSHYFLFVLDRQRIDPSFLGYYAKTPEFWEQVAARGTTNYAAIRPDHVLGYAIPLPPLQEQQRIVGKIDRLAAKVKEGLAVSGLADVESDALIGSRAARLFSSSIRTAVGEIADVRAGIQKGPHRAPGANPVRYVTVAHVQRNRVLTDSPRFFEVAPAELARWRLLAGDVLIIEGNGSAEQIGRTALFRGEIENCVHQNHVIRIRVDRERMMPEFLNAFLNSPAGQDAVQKKSRTTTGLRTLSVARIKGIEIPMPPLTEQEKVIRAIDKLSAVAEELKRARQAIAAELGALLPSILDRAFKGGL